MERKRNEHRASLIVAKVITFYCALLIMLVSQPERSNFRWKLTDSLPGGEFNEEQNKQILGK